ncbi:phage tail protein [Eggerthella sinensis]|nr:phage tail protein [Eggerthella sinensis]
MWRVFYGPDVIYDPRDPELTLTGMEGAAALTEAGEFSFTMPPAHPFSGRIECLQKDVEIVVEQDGETVFCGRAMVEAPDFLGNVTYTCEGERAYLNDIVLPAYSTVDKEGFEKAPAQVDALFNWYVAEYNSRVSPRHRFIVGVNEGAQLDPNNHLLRESSQRPTVWAEMREKLIDKLGGWVRVRHEGGMRRIDWLADGGKACAQRIEFGVNLMDYARERNYLEYCTKIVPVGEDDDGNEVTISSLPDGALQEGYEKRGDGVVSIEGERKYGIVEKVVEFDDASTPAYLLSAGTRNLVNRRVGDTLEIRAVDLHQVDPSVERITLGSYVRATSKPHGLDEYFLCFRIPFNPGEPGGCAYTLGNTYDTLTGKQSSKLAALNGSINKTYEAMAPIDQAAKDAAKAAQAAKDRADAAQGSADAAKEAADKAKAEADKAAADAIQAAKDALEAKREADGATAKVEIVETDVTAVKQAVAAAQGAADAAGEAAGSAAAKADAANKAATDAKSEAASALADAGGAIATAEAAQAEAANAKADAAEARAEIAGQIKTVTDTMAADYSRKTDLTQTEAKLVSEIERSAAGITSTVAETYAKKTDLTTVESGLQTQITQNAGAIESTAKSVAKADTKANDAAEKAAAAGTAASKAQADAAAAKSNATAAQTAADAAAKNLAVAEANLDTVTAHVGATEADVKAAEAAVAAAKSAADAAQSAATTAKANAETAQATADAAKTAATNAQKAADALGTRVAAAETKITQTSEQIKLAATKAEVATTLGGYYTSAQTDAAIKVRADAITSTVSSVKATADAAKKKVVHATSGTSGTAGILLLAEISVRSAYANTPIAVAVSQRGRQPSTAYIEFSSANSTDPGVSKFEHDGDSTFYLGKASSGVWNLYCPKTEAYDTATVTGCDVDEYLTSRIAIAWKTTQVAAVANLPSGYLTAKKLVSKEPADAIATKAELKIESDRITSNVSETSGLKTRVSTVEQTASGLSVSLGNTDKAAAAAKTAADAAKSTADAASAKAAAAAGDATAAKNSAAGAAATANAASTAAGTAKTAADAASARAATASSDASAAKTAAGTAATTANAAKTAADTAKSTADTAKANAATAQSAADAAKTAADAAAKTATNYMEYTSSGLDVGNKASGKWAGFRSRMAAGAFQILDAAGTIVASYGASVVEIGRNAKTAVVKLCGGIGEIAGSVGATRDLLKVSSNGDLWIKGYGVTVEGDHLELVGGSSATLNGRSVPGMESSGGYWGLVAPDGSASAYVRTTSSGIIPYQSGGASSIGTAGWPFNSIYGKAVYVDGVSLASTVSDSGWVWLKGPSGTDKQGVKYRLKAGVVYLVADLGGDSGITVASGGTSLGTLPAGYRPASTVLAACTGKGNNLGQLRVTPAGAVTAFLFGSSSAYFAASLTYPVG